MRASSTSSSGSMAPGSTWLWMTTCRPSMESSCSSRATTGGEDFLKNSLSGNLNRGEMWPCLVEKAYAKLHGSYQHLSMGVNVNMWKQFYDSDLCCSDACGSSG